jgi:hypothetical protein
LFLIQDVPVFRIGEVMPFETIGIIDEIFGDFLSAL